MNGEQINRDNNQPNEAYDIWKNVSNEATGKNEENPNPDMSESNNVEAPQSEENELTPQQIEWREGYTDEDVDKLADTWDRWGAHGIGYDHGKILEEMFYNEELGWKYTDFNDFFENSSEIAISEMDENLRTVSDKLDESLSTLKQALGEDSPEYKSAVEKIFIDIRNGKYKGSRLKYNGYYNGYSKGDILFSDQEEDIRRDDQEREKIEQKKLEETKEMEKRRKEMWENSWRNPANDETYRENKETIDERTFSYLNHMVGNLDTIAPKERDLVMDAINQSILEGKFNGAYLDNRGYFHIGKLADEYRGYDQEDKNSASSEDEPSKSPIIRPNSNNKENKPKTPDDFGFRDWNNQ